jgi:hypothetical protein
VAEYATLFRHYELADYDKDPLLRQRLKEFRHHYGQPPEVRREFVEAMGIGGA